MKKCAMSQWIPANTWPLQDSDPPDAAKTLATWPADLGRTYETMANKSSSSPLRPQYVRRLRGLLKGGKGMKALREDRRMEKER